MLCKFKLISKEHKELKLSIESIKNKTNDSLKKKQYISCAIFISKVDALTSCIDLIDESFSNPCNEKCNEKVKGMESKLQLSQDNCEDMVKKLEKGSTVTCSKCHPKGHKSNKRPQPKEKLPDEKNKKKTTIKSSLIYTKPNRKNKSKSSRSRRRAMARWLLTRLGRRIGVGTSPFGCPRKSSPT